MSFVSFEEATPLGRQTNDIKGAIPRPVAFSSSIKVTVVTKPKVDVYPLTLTVVKGDKVSGLSYVS